VYEDEFVFAFRDISPQAPVHILIIPKEHIASAAEIDAENSHLTAKCFEAITKIAETEGLKNGFRIITNSGPDGNQTVRHLHYHLLGGKAFKESLV
jgi:histidine triad (HIT) family protein